MKDWLWTRTLNERLALLALVLGLVAVAATPYRGGRAVVDAKDLTAEIAAGHGRVTPLELADWIIQDREDFRLIDLRSEAEFQRYHIPTAENVPVERLGELAIGHQEKVLVYAASDLPAAQAWLVLRSQGYRGVSVLDGSLGRWNDEVLFPVIPDGQGAAVQADAGKLRAVCAFFGGRPRIGGRDAVGFAAPLALPAPVAAPPAPKAGGKAPAVKKKEGC